MAILNTIAWIRHPELDYFGTPWNVFNSITNILLLIYIVAYPIYGFIVIYRNRTDLGSKHILERVGVLYEEQRYNSLHGATFNIREMQRRSLMVVIITGFYGMPYFQVVWLVIFSMLTLVMLSHANAFTTKNDNKFHLLNEFIVYTCTWVSIIFQMDIPENQKAIWTVGWIVIFLNCSVFGSSIICSLYE